MTIIEIVAKYLIENGYDGLVNPDSECGCAIDDICPSLDSYWGSCLPAYKVPADAAFKENWGDECTEMFCTEKPESKEK